MSEETQAVKATVPKVRRSGGSKPTKKVSAKRKEVSREAAPEVIGRKKQEASVNMAPANFAARQRKDPEARHFDASPIWNKLTREVDGHHYVWANKGCSQTGASYYRSIGYTTETYERNGVRPLAVNEAEVERLKGQEIEMRGSVLMSCDGETYKNIIEYGAEGNSGMNLIRERMSRVTREKPPELSNYNRRYFGLKNETQ